GHEYRQWISRALDVSSDMYEKPVQAARLALDELIRLQGDATAPLVLGEKCVAWRGGARWLAEVASARLEAPTQPWELADDAGPILITGGLGGIGLSFAETLVRHGARQLILVGRSALPPAEQWPQIL